MQKSSYTCDVCFDVVRNEKCEVKSDFIGFEFDTGDYAGRSFREKQFNLAARHICLKCLAALAKLAEGYKK